jgi:hypothetical protein
MQNYDNAAVKLAIQNVGHKLEKKVNEEGRPKDTKADQRTAPRKVGYMR